METIEDANRYEMKVNDTRLVWFRRQQEIVPSYEWQSFMPWHILPLGIDINWHFVDPRLSMMKIPEKFTLQVFLGPDFRIIKFHLDRDTTAKEVLEKTSEVTGLDSGCLALWDFGHGEEVDPEETVESLQWFLRRNELKLMVDQRSPCFPPARCGVYFRPAKLQSQSSAACGQSEPEFWELYRRQKLGELETLA